MDMYREIILDHYKHPRNFGHLPHAAASAHAFNATCGDKISMEISVNTNKEIEDIRFSGEGCAISQAAASMLTEEVKGKRVSRVMNMKAPDMIQMIGSPLTPSRIKCATLPLEVLQKAILSLKET
jgi:nitrogen fixation NifU-like protein